MFKHQAQPYYHVERNFCGKTPPLDFQRAVVKKPIFAAFTAKMGSNQHPVIDGLRLCDHCQAFARADGAVTFANGKGHSFFQRNRLAQFYYHLKGIARHNHIHPFR